MALITVTHGWGDEVVQAQDEQLFLSQSIEGGAITTYMANGEEVSVQLRWAKVADADPTATSSRRGHLEPVLQICY